MPRKTPAPIYIDSATRSVKTFPPTIQTSTLRPTTSFDEILEHQFKIKGLDKDYVDDKFERFGNQQPEEEEKLIGVLGSQVSYFCIKLWLDNF
jgi:hypothetical protein